MLLSSARRPRAEALLLLLLLLLVSGVAAFLRMPPAPLSAAHRRIQSRSRSQSFSGLQQPLSFRRAQAASPLLALQGEEEDGGELEKLLEEDPREKSAWCAS